MTDHAAYFNSPSGVRFIRESIQKSFEGLSDREVAALAFRSQSGLADDVDQEYFAELEYRGLADTHTSEREVYVRISLREGQRPPASSKTASPRLGAMN